MNPTQWDDADGDGWGDNFNNISWQTLRPSSWPGQYDVNATQVDTFPNDPTQWNDTDGDWLIGGGGDEPAPANNPDGCPNAYGNSSEDRNGCYAVSYTHLTLPTIYSV